MKYLFGLLVFVALSGCNKPDRIEIDGTAPGIKSGVFGVVDVLNKPVYGENIIDGKFKINELLNYPGYYAIKVTDMLNTKDRYQPYEVYLENGQYAVELNTDLNKYPRITTESKIQNELSAYYTLADELIGDLPGNITKQIAYLNSQEAKAKSDYMDQVDKLKEMQARQEDIKASLIEKFIAKYPESTITAHLIHNLDYRSDPLRYYTLFNKLSDAAKNTDEGKDLNQKLSLLVKLVPGGTGPQIYGTDPDGKKFDPKSVKKKLILIDFWRSGNQVSRTNHLQMDQVFFQVNNKGFGVISIDLDEKKDWWLTAIREDKMKWPQYSDLKGNDSQNAAAWGITRIPSYYLLDGNWKIVKRDVAFDDISYEAGKYLEKHK